MVLQNEYKELRDLASKFADGEVMPLAKNIDSDAYIPDGLRASLAESGFMGIFIPQEYGGAGMDYVSYAIIVEELSRACASTGVLVSAHNSLAVWPILTYGSKEQKS